MKNFRYDFLKDFAIWADPALWKSDPKKPDKEILTAHIFFVYWGIRKNQKGEIRAEIQAFSSTLPLEIKDESEITEELKLECLDKAWAEFSKQFEDKLENESYISIAPPQTIPDKYKKACSWIKSPSNS